MTRSTVSKLSLAVLALGAAACGQQSGMDYRGEPLFTLRGTVTVPKEFAGEDLVPVLFFPLEPDPETGGRFIEVLDVDVTGSFPSNFRIDVFDAPPQPALNFAEDLPKFAVGYLAAMSPSHPSRLKVFEGYPDFVELRRYCTADESTCLEQRWSCPDQDFLNCTLLSTSGDPSLTFAGYALNVIVTYAPEPIAADSALAFLWGTGEAMPAGYHLRRVKHGINQSFPEIQVCVAHAWRLALDDYNAMHETKHLDATSLEVPWDFFALNQARRRDGGCPQPPFTLIDDPANTFLSIALGAEGPLNSEYP